MLGTAGQFGGQRHGVIVTIRRTEIPPPVAVIPMVRVALTEWLWTMNVACVCPAGTTTVGGTVKYVVRLEGMLRATVSPFAGAGLLRPTEHDAEEFWLMTGQLTLSK